MFVQILYRRNLWNLKSSLNISKLKFREGLSPSGDARWNSGGVKVRCLELKNVGTFSELLDRIFPQLIPDRGHILQAGHPLVPGPTVLENPPLTLGSVYLKHESRLYNFSIFKMPFVFVLAASHSHNCTVQIFSLVA